jgi:ABC transporter substrate binding protein (PQQ-dependent alcohol dehydrogenase system)
MTTARAIFVARLFAASAIALLLTDAAHAATAFKLTLIVRDDDPRLARNRVERAYLGHPGGPVSDGLALALDDARFELDAAGVEIALSTVTVASVDAARAAAVSAEKAGAAALVTDLPANATRSVAEAVKLPVLNVGEAADTLRAADCRPNLFHVPPSERMRADALAQALVARKWTQVLLLAGPSADDAPRVAAATAAIRRYALKLVDTRPFKLSADPRERDLANTALLTGRATYDVVWVVDSDGEFARGLPYRTALPRPVVGDGGLAALGWHAQFERFGAPQVSRRFAKAHNRPMTQHDWASWIAGRALAAAAVAAPKGPGAAFAKALADVEIDGSKGVAMSFRAWDGQLRQPLLLTDGQGVVGLAPSEGVLHPKNVLDTLGADAPEKLCKARGS